MKKTNIFFLYISSIILISTWSDVQTLNLDLLPRHHQDPEKGQEPPAQVLAISELLLLPLNFLTTEAL